MTRTNKDFINFLSYLSEDIAFQCRFALDTESLSDDYIDGLLEYIIDTAQGYQEEWQELKKVRENNAKDK